MQDAKILEGVQQFKSKRGNGSIDWIKVADHVGNNRSGRVVASRYRCNLDPKLQQFNHAKITPDEVSFIYYYYYLMFLLVLEFCNYQLYILHYGHIYMLIVICRELQ